MFNYTKVKSERSVLGARKRAGCLRIVYTERRDKIRVVTAYEMTKEQQRLYFEGK